MREGIESTSEFVVSGSDTAELIEAIEEALYEIACFITVPVDRPLVLPVATGRNVGKSPRCFDTLDQLIAVIVLFSRNCGGLNAFHEGGTLGDIGHLPTGQNQAKGVTQSIDAGVYLGGQPTSLATNRLIATVFWVRSPNAGGYGQWSRP